MAVDLESRIRPGQVALVTQECQSAIIGSASPLADLAAAAKPIKANIARLAGAARAARVPVVHCTFLRRADGMAANSNARLFAAMERAAIDLRPGSDGAAIDSEIDPHPDDIVLSRYHGVGPMGGTDLDPVLRNLGAKTIVGVGVSLNVGMLSLVLDAVNLGYDVVIPVDAVAGVPEEYANAVVDNTLSWLATIATTDDIVTAWSGPSAEAAR